MGPAKSGPNFTQEEMKEMEVLFDERDMFSVAFNSNGGNGYVVRTGDFDTCIVLPDGSEFSRCGYYLDGWQSEKGVFFYSTGTSAAGKRYPCCATGLIRNFESVLYAVWKPIDHFGILRFGSGGGFGESFSAVQ